MAGRVLEPRKLGLILVTTLLIGALLTGESVGLPQLAPPGTTVQVGETGIEEGSAFAQSEDQILVAPGARITLQADYRFEAASHASGETNSYRAFLSAQDGSGALGTDSAHALVTTTDALSESGTLELHLSVPEVGRSITVTLQSFLQRAGSGGFETVDDAKSSSVLTIIAVPEPTAFASESLVVDDALSLGSITFNDEKRDVNASDGHVFVSTDIGTRFTADVFVDAPDIPAASYIEVHISVTAIVRVQDGPTYSDHRVVFQRFCDDWSTHSCSSTPQTRELDLEVVLPAGALPPGSVVTTQLHINHMVNWFHGGQNTGGNDHVFQQGLGRHMVLSG